MKFKSIRTGEVYDCWDLTPCEPKDFGNCNNCPIHERYDRYCSGRVETLCSDIVEQYPEAARLIGYEPVDDTPQPESGMDSKLTDFFERTYHALKSTMFCAGVVCDNCPFNTPLGQPCGANQIMKAMEKMDGASKLSQK